jgi:hypothetical protein
MSFMSDIKLENNALSKAALKDWIRTYYVYCARGILTTEEKLKLNIAMKYYISTFGAEGGNSGYGYGYEG